MSKDNIRKKIDELKKESEVIWQLSYDNPLKLLSDAFQNVEVRKNI